MGPARLEVEDLVVAFGGLRAVDGVSLVAEPGSIVGLIGPNGSGKTTTLDAVSGNVRAASGSVRVDGVDLTDFLPEERIGSDWSGPSRTAGSTPNSRSKTC